MWKKDIPVESPSVSPSNTPTGTETEFENSDAENEEGSLAEETESSPPSIEDKAKAAMESLEVWDGSIAESFDGGDGSAENPYQIANGAQLAKLASDTNSGIDFNQSYFILTSDILLNDISQWNFEDSITMDSTALTSNFTDFTNEWIPIGLNHQFKGTFNGDGHIVFGLFLASAYYNSFYKNISQTNTGLFGEVDDGTISNVNIACGGIGSLSESVGGIVGQLYNGNIDNCHVQQMFYRPGAASDGVICKIGGVCGEAAGGTIANCSASGLIVYNHNYAKNFYLGGVVGYGYYDEQIENCFNSCDIVISVDVAIDYSNNYDLPGIDVGGICGRLNGTLSKCYNSGSINIMACDKLSDDSIDEPYVDAGGIVGICVGNIENCGSNGKLNYSGDIAASNLGGVAGSLGDARPYGDFSELSEVKVAFCYSNIEINSEVACESMGGIAGCVCGEITLTNGYYNKEYASSAIATTVARKKKLESKYSLNSKVFTDQIKGVSEDELRDIANYYNWDFDTTWTMDAKINDGLPVLMSCRDYLNK